MTPVTRAYLFDSLFQAVAGNEALYPLFGDKQILFLGFFASLNQMTIFGMKSVLS